MPWFKILIFYLLSGFGGYLFGATCDTQGYLFVGCQPATCGFIGGMTALMIVNTKALAPLGAKRYCLIALFPILFLVVLLYTMSSWKVLPNFFKPNDPYAQLGGLLSGLFLGLAMVPRVRRIGRMNGSFEKKLVPLGMGLLLLMWSILLLCFFLADSYPRIYPGTIN